MKKYIKCADIDNPQGGKYYKYSEDVDPQFDEDVQETMDAYGLKLIGWAEAKDKYYDQFLNNGIEIAAIGRDNDTGSIGLYLVVNDRVYDIMDEVNQVIEN